MNLLRGASLLALAKSIYYIIGFDKVGIDINDITSIQRRTSNNSWW